MCVHLKGKGSMNRRLRSPILSCVAVLAMVLVAAPAHVIPPTQATASRALGGRTPDVVLRGGATRLGHHDPADMLTLDIGLFVRDSAGLDAMIAAAGDPASPTFGQYLTQAQYLDRYG